MSHKAKLVVVKYGSNTVADDRGMRYDRIAEYAEHLAKISDKYRLVVVSSGSIAGGQALWRQQKGSEEIPSLQSLATIGSARCFAAWQDALLEKNILTGQVLVTHHDIDDAETAGQGSGANKLRELLRTNMDNGVVSIVNENDALSDEEIMKWKHGGDNDGLASHIAKLLQAEHLCLLTNVEGLMDETGGVVTVVEPDNFKQAQSLAGAENVSRNGRGGMYSKVQAAHSAALAGIESHIGLASSGVEELLMKRSGTHFPVVPAA
jgi:glutamate 5-kinase